MTCLVGTSGNYIFIDLSKITELLDDGAPIQGVNTFKIISCDILYRSYLKCYTNKKNIFFKFYSLIKLAGQQVGRSSTVHYCYPLV
jgi:hypothetical protein